MSNSFRGEVPLQVEGRSLTLRLTWAAHDQLIERLGDDYGSTSRLRDLSVLVEELSGGEISAEEVYEASPPVKPAMAAVQRAILLGWLGPDDAREEAGEAADGPFSRLAGVFAAFWSGRSKQGSAMPSSGA